MDVLHFSNSNNCLSDFIFVIIRYGIFECCDSLGDAVLSFCCPNCYAALAADVSGKSIPYAIVQCLCFPFAVCFLRGHARKKHNIQYLDKQFYFLYLVKIDLK